jgi:hypothetical protein
MPPNPPAVLSAAQDAIVPLPIPTDATEDELIGL